LTSALPSTAFTFQGELPVFSLCEIVNEGGLGGNNLGTSSSQKADHMAMKVVATHLNPSLSDGRSNHHVCKLN
jgi:hypothetical protein